MDFTNPLSRVLCVSLTVDNLYANTATLPLLFTLIWAPNFPNNQVFVSDDSLSQ